MVFNDKKNSAKRRGANFHESAVTILTPGCHFNGKLYCRGSSRIGGRIEGEIVSEGLLIVEEEAHISACIQAEEAIIQGKVSGTLKASGRVELADRCCFDGDIITPALVIHEGAQFNGKTSMPETEATKNKESKKTIVPEKSGAQASV
ncbi:MAG: polymer-forming cytoskeletal protein [Oligoflexales bacterium]